MVVGVAARLIGHIDLQRRIDADTNLDRVFGNIIADLAKTSLRRSFVAFRAWTLHCSLPCFDKPQSRPCAPYAKRPASAGHDRSSGYRPPVGAEEPLIGRTNRSNFAIMVRL